MKQILFIGYIIVATVCVTPTLIYANDFDPFFVNGTVTKYPSKDVIPINLGQNPCRFAVIGASIDLVEVVERSLCHNPQTQQVWANVKTQAAQVGISQSAYFPTINAGYGQVSGPESKSLKGLPQISYDVNTRTHTSNVNLSWTLFDFGLRSANLENSRHLLVAANATQDATLQKVFMTAAQAYYDFRTAQAALDASIEAEKSAQESFMAADAKYTAGVGSLADKLQAQTNCAQAKSNRVKANGDLNSSQGALAISMGLNANTAFTLSDDKAPLPDDVFVRSIDALIEEAVRTHPSLIAAQAQLKAAQTKVDATSAEGLPSVVFIGSFNKSDQFGQYPRDTVVKSESMGFQVIIPLFEGFGRSYRIQSAKAQVESKMADLANTEQQISLDVWKSYQLLVTTTEYLNTTDDLLHSADQSFKVALGRYKSGVGNILELLSAQSTFAGAQQQRIQALSNWQSARLKLAGSLGKLGLWSIR